MFFCRKQVAKRSHLKIFGSRRIAPPWIVTRLCRETGGAPPAGGAPAFRSAGTIRALGAALHRGGRLHAIGVACSLAAALLAGPVFAAEGTAGRDPDPRSVEEKARAAEEKGEVLEDKASAGGDKGKPAAAQTITRPEAEAVDPRGEEPLNDALTCLARSIYWEAKGEDRPGMEAIANVVMNRLGNGSFPNTVCGVVKEGKESGACQFSWWCDGRPDDVEEESRYTITMEIARQALNRQLPDRTNGALYFHAGTVTPSWDDDYVQTTEFGHHRFYKPKGGKAK